MRRFLLLFMEIWIWISKLNDTLNWFAVTLGAGFKNTGVAGGFINFFCIQNIGGHRR